MQSGIETAPVHTPIHLPSADNVGDESQSLLLCCLGRDPLNVGCSRRCGTDDPFC